MCTADSWPAPLVPPASSGHHLHLCESLPQLRFLFPDLAFACRHAGSDGRPHLVRQRSPHSRGLGGGAGQGGARRREGGLLYAPTQFSVLVRLLLLSFARPVMFVCCCAKCESSVLRSAHLCANAESGWLVLRVQSRSSRWSCPSDTPASTPTVPTAPPCSNPPTCTLCTTRHR